LACYAKLVFREGYLVNKMGNALSDLGATIGEGTCVVVAKVEVAAPEVVSQHKLDVVVGMQRDG
jgi:hypothetical protein